MPEAGSALRRAFHLLRPGTQQRVDQFLGFRAGVGKVLPCSSLSKREPLLEFRFSHLPDLCAGAFEYLDDPLLHLDLLGDEECFTLGGGFFENIPLRGRKLVSGLLGYDQGLNDHEYRIVAADGREFQLLIQAHADKGFIRGKQTVKHT